MNKDKIAELITKAIYKNSRNLQELKGYNTIKKYFLDLKEEDLIGIASVYGVNT